MISLKHESCFFNKVGLFYWLWTVNDIFLFLNINDLRSCFATSVNFRGMHNMHNENALGKGVLWSF